MISPPSATGSRCVHLRSATGAGASGLTLTVPFLIVLAGLQSARAERIEIGANVTTASIRDGDRTIAGAVVRWVEASTPLGRAGIPAGSLIVRYGTDQIDSQGALAAAVRRRGLGPVEVEVYLPRLAIGQLRQRRVFTLEPRVRREEPRGPRVYFVCVVGTQQGDGLHPLAGISAERVKTCLENDPVSSHLETSMIVGDDFRSGVELWNAVRRRFAELATAAGAEDTVFVYITTHGAQDPNRANDGQHGHKLQFGSPSAGQAVDRYRAEVMELLPRQVRLQVLITDSCASVSEQRPETKTRMEQRTVEVQSPTAIERLLLHSRGTVSLNGCRMGEKGWYVAGHGGLFTNSCVDILELGNTQDWQDFITEAKRRTSTAYRALEPARGQLDQVPFVFVNSVRTEAVQSGNSVSKTVTIRVPVPVRD